MAHTSLKSGEIDTIIYSVHEILPGLWIGGEGSARDSDFFQKHKIHSVVNCTTHIPNYFQEKGVKYLRVPVYDSPDQKIDQYFEQAKSFILTQLKKNGYGVLVHCAAGISRSSSVMIAFFMKVLNVPYETAYNMLKTKRQFIQPNQGFEQKLKKLQIMR